MADLTITRGNTLPNSSQKADFHNLIDLATGSVSNIVNADIDSAAAIADTKLATISTANKVSASAVGAITGLTEKVTIVADDVFIIADSEASNATKKVKSSTLSTAYAKSPVTGGFKNLAISRTNVTTVAVTADEIILNNGSKISSVSFSVAITTSGVGGLDTGSEASGTWYYIYALSASTGIISASASAPDGQTVYALVGAVRNDGSSNFVNFIQSGNEYWYSTWQSAASGNVGLNPWVAINTTAFVPSALSDVVNGVVVRADTRLAITNDNGVTLSASDGPTAGQTNYVGEFGGAVSGNSKPFKFNIKTANTLYWISSNTNNYVWISGFIVTKL